MVTMFSPKFLYCFADSAAHLVTLNLLPTRQQGGGFNPPTVSVVGYGLFNK
jgi:hypothetical protein